MTIALVVVGYNRPESMNRLLNTLLLAKYGNDTVDLVISIDKGPNQQKVIDVAECVKWVQGKKIIRSFTIKQGLRKHIIQCGDLTEQYDAVIVLEDDLVVSPYFYYYVKQVMCFYESEDRIAGISLYKHQTHPGVCRPFEPANNGFDVFMMQFAMSWGQCWTKHMWRNFKDWYLKNENKDLSQDGILPTYISNWNKQSWLKYYMRYIVENDKYFVYPYFSFASNASDLGEHCSIPNNDYQVSLSEGILEYRLPNFADAIKYDVFFERVNLCQEIFPELIGKKILDLYGDRIVYGDARYLISTKALPFKVVKEFQLKYRPIEHNCLNPDDGVGVIVYDLSVKAAIPKVNNAIVTRYDVRAIHWKKLLFLGFIGLIDALKRRVNK